MTIANISRFVVVTTAVVLSVAPGLAQQGPPGCAWNKYLYAQDAVQPGNKRYEVEFSNWKLNDRVNAAAFSSSSAQKAPRIEFRNPDAEARQKP
jgi:Predicted periplasmic protein (DUF2092)